MHYDIPSGIVTVLVAPLFTFLLWRIQKFARIHSGFILDALFWQLGRLFHRGWATRVSLRGYVNSELANDYSRLVRVPGRAADVPLKTDEIFIPLVLEMAAGTDGRFGVDNLSSAGSRVLVIGDPGSGKSTLTKAHHRRECREEKIDGDHTKSKLSILVEVKDLIPPFMVTDEDHGLWLIEYLRQKVAKADGFDMGSLFDAYLTGDGISANFDGLDELSTDRYPAVVKCLLEMSKQLAARSPKSDVVLTMRSQFYNQVREDLHVCFSVVLVIHPFTPSDVYNFLSNWPFKDRKARDVNRIYEQLSDNPALSELCTNPLVLAMYVANDQQAGDASASPDTRTTFYDHVMEELLVRRRAEQTGTPARGVLREQREEILGSLAWNNLTDPSQPANSISWAKAIAAVGSVFGCSTAEAERHLQELIRDTGVIASERPGETLHFNHLTFCEFLAAVECVRGRERGWNELMEKSAALHGSSHNDANRRTRLDEVIPFAVGLTSRNMRMGALSDVWSLSDRPLFAHCLLESKGYRHEQVARFVEEEANYLASVTEAQWDADWLKHLHLFGRTLRDMNFTSDTGITPFMRSEAFYERLVGGSESKLLKLFSAYAAQDPPAALRLADDVGVDVVCVAPYLIVANCDQPAFFSMAAERANDAETADTGAWARAIVEASLSSQVVALRAHGIPSQGRLAVASKTVKRRRHWMANSTGQFGLLRSKSLYTDCLTIAVEEQRTGGVDERLWPYLARLRGVRPPGAHWHGLFFLWPLLVFSAAFAVMLVLIFLALILLLLNNPEGLLSPVESSTTAGTESIGQSFIDFLPAFFLTMALVFYTTYPMYRASIYERLWNLQETSSMSRKKAARTRRIAGWSLFQRAAVRNAYGAMVRLERMRSRTS